MDINSAEYINCKNQLEEIYDDIAEGVEIKNKYQWYEEGEKSTKFFLNLEKRKATKGTVKKLEMDNKEIDNHVEINKELEKIFEDLFKSKLRKTQHVYNEFLGDISLPALSQEEKQFVTKKLKVILALKSFSDNKSPGNDGLTKEFYETFGKN